VTEPAPPDPTFPRLTTRAFPHYRFVPGRSPHPRADPRGHSHGQPTRDHSEEARAARDDWRASPSFCYSVDLYNYAYWWEAHEGWENLWRCYPPEDPLRFALQAFIQLSAAHLQRFMGKETGVRTLLRHTRRHLDAARPAGGIVFGCNLETWWREAVTPFFDDPQRNPYPFLRPA
jgi:hypothetical protein